MTACSSILGDTPTDSSSDVTEPADSTTQPSPEDCIRFTGDHTAHIDSGSLASDALFLSGETFLCATDVIIVGEGDLNEIAVAAQLAAAVSGPLLFPEPRLAAELGRLKPSRVHLVGSVDVNVPGVAEIVSHDLPSAVAMTLEALESTAQEPGPASADSTTVIDTVAAIDMGDRVLSPQRASTSTTATTDIESTEIVTGMAPPSNASSLWIVDASSPATILLAAAVGHSIGAGVVAIDGADILGYPQVGEALVGRSTDSIRYVGATPEASDWELGVLTGGQQVPGGGFTILPREGTRRYVAYYGHPGTASLGVLGEQGPAETRTAMQGLVEAYSGDGAQVIPTFEIIASVASAGAGEDGDYSTEWSPETFDDWIAHAADNDMYVVLDLQSGREDFLSQAMIYEELLKLPFVGLALDPEWRLTDDQVHLEQTGTVDAVEINETVNWVADLVRENGLPQKMMIVHQFKTSMITNRDQIVERPEIQMIVQMDGDGREADKDRTWSILLEGASDAHWSWGWKNFFDEDEPGPPTPESTMSKQPSPVFVSYQ